MKKYKYNIVNLDCPNCARKIEDALNKNDKLNNVIVNFNTLKLIYETDKDVSINEINNEIRKIDSNVYIDCKSANKNKDYNFTIFIIAIIVAIFGMYIKINDIFNEILIIVSYILLLYRPFINSLKSIIKNKTINENLLITISSIGAYLVNEKMEGIMVVALYTIGKLLEQKALNNSRNSIKALLDIKQDYANVKINDEIKKIDIEDVKKEDILVIKKGEKVPTDGVIISGSTYLDTSMLTGESELKEVNIDDIVLSGSINTKNIIEIKATTNYYDSTLSKILDIVENSTDKKSHKETLVSKFSKIYTPTVLILSILSIFILHFIFDIPKEESVYRALTFLVISCPCAIAISVPLSYFSAIGVSSKNGILIKGSNYLDNLSNINKIIFDKTGTLTIGEFDIENIEVKDYSKKDAIDILVNAESYSNHPIAKSIMKLKNNKTKKLNITNYKEKEGLGIECKVSNKNIKIGNKTLCNCNYDSDIHLNIEDNHIASIYVNDGIKENAKDVISKLKNYKIDVYMFTGDKKEVAMHIAKKLGIENVKYEMLPIDKYEYYKKIKNDKEIVTFVGDGINDSPVLKISDIGISMGSMGSEIAIDSSDIVIMNDDLNNIIKGIKISRFTNHIIKQNLAFAISVKILILVFSLFGLSNMILAVFADTGVTLLTILNTLRILRKEY